MPFSSNIRDMVHVGCLHMFNPYLPTTIWHWHCLGKIGSNIASATSAACGSPIVQNGPWAADFCSHLLLTSHELRKLNFILQASPMISVSRLGPSFVSLIPSPGASCLSNPRKETRVSRPKTI
ncbi:hypothetical protein V8C40DRAFT_273842 [Trichoderma camerunense]